jgi:predicted transcriptional regulator
MWPPGPPHRLPIYHNLHGRLICLTLSYTAKEMVMPHANISESVTLRIPSDIVSDIETIAEATERSRSYIIVRALRTYLMNEGSGILAAIRGRDQILNGEHEDMDDVLADIDRIVSGKVA